MKNFMKMIIISNQNKESKTKIVPITIMLVE